MFSVPPHLQVVGAAADGLVAVRGGFRARRLILWDPQLEEQIRDLGWVIAVREVLDRYALVTTGCLTSGCTTAMVDVVTGNSTDVDIPLGWREVGEPRLIPEVDGVAVVVADMSGQTALAIGAPDDLQVVAELEPGTGMQALPGPGGWLLVPLADGDVAAWREGMGDAGRRGSSCPMASSWSALASSVRCPRVEAFAADCLGDSRSVEIRGDSTEPEGPASTQHHAEIDVGGSADHTFVQHQADLLGECLQDSVANLVTRWCVRAGGDQRSDVRVDRRRTDFGVVDRAVAASGERIQGG